MKKLNFQLQDVEKMSYTKVASQVGYHQNSIPKILLKEIIRQLQQNSKIYHK